MTLTPSSSRAGLPSGWSQSDTGAVIAEATVASSESPLVVQGVSPGQDPADVRDLLIVQAGGGGQALEVLSDGTTYIRALGVNAIPLSLIGFAGQANSLFEIRSSTFTRLLRVGIGGHLGIQTHSAPADGDIATGEVTLWFDQTNGVGNTKLMLKGKSADGTVKTASIVLA